MRKIKPPVYSSLLKERDSLIKELNSVSFILRGSLRRQGNVCGRPDCSCKRPKNPKLHGPYNYLSHRYKDRSQTIFLNDKKFAFAQEGIAGYDRVMDIIYRLCDVNFRILRYHYNKL